MRVFFKLADRFVNISREISECVANIRKCVVQPPLATESGRAFLGSR